MIATQGMWELVSELLEGEKLPESLNETLYGLCDGTLKVVSANQFKSLNDLQVPEDARDRLHEMEFNKKINVPTNNDRRNQLLELARYRLLSPSEVKEFVILEAKVRGEK